MCDHNIVRIYNYEDDNYFKLNDAMRRLHKKTISRIVINMRNRRDELL